MTNASVVDDLASGRAFVDLSPWRKVAVAGHDALQWLNDLVTSDLSGLGPGRARQALLLSPTGRIRAEFAVSHRDSDLLLLQDPSHPTPVDALLVPYVLSSDVRLEDRTGDLAMFAVPGGSGAPAVPGTTSSEPSCLGSGFDLLALATDHRSTLRTLSETYEQASGDALEAWRIMAGAPRVGVDVLDSDLPQEAGLEWAVSFDKGCFLGQEAVAKVRNLGHPRRVLLHFVADEEVAPNEPVEVDGAPVGEVTSSWGGQGRWWLLARVRWDSRDRPVRTATGVRLEPAPRP